MSQPSRAKTRDGTGTSWPSGPNQGKGGCASGEPQLILAEMRRERERRPHEGEAIDRCPQHAYHPVPSLPADCGLWVVRQVVMPRPAIVPRLATDTRSVCRSRRHVRAVRDELDRSRSLRGGGALRCRGRSVTAILRRPTGTDWATCWSRTVGAPIKLQFLWQHSWRYQRPFKRTGTHRRRRQSIVRARRRDLTTGSRLESLLAFPQFLPALPPFYFSAIKPGFESP